MQWNWGWVALLAGLVSPAFAPAYAEESHPGIAAESLYSEAVLAFNKKQTQEALKILDQLLQSSPNHVEALELKALSLKTQGNDPKSLEVYSKLVQLKPPAERGPYHFEIGVILQRHKKNDQARAHFQRAVLLKTNVVPSRLFLGLIAFGSGNLSGASSEFERVKAEGTPEFQVVARYYLGLIHFKNGYGAGGTSELMAARSIASEIPESKMAQDIKEAAEKIMAPFNTVQWFANVSVLGQYDGNISQVPSEIPGSTSVPTNLATAKIALSGAAGRVSSPMRTIQWVGSGRFSVNKNLNAETKTYEFATLTPSLFVNYKPLSITSAGLKLEGSYSFQNQPSDEDSTAYLYGPYNLGGELGPYVKTQLDDKTVAQLDLFYRPTKYYSDTAQTGKSGYGRLSLKRDSGSRFWNPGGSLSFERMLADSVEYRYFAAGVGAYDQIRLTAKDSITVSADFLFTKYAEASIPRNDRNYVLRTSLVRTVNRSWSIVGDLSYTRNISDSPESYTYTRLTGSLGASWNL